MDNISDLEKSFLEAKDYSEAQFAVIVQLQEKNAKLIEENNHLKKLVEQNIPSIGGAPYPNDLVPGITNEQIICEIEIKRLKDRSIVQELNKEEAQKLQIYVTILEQVRSKTKDDSLNVESVSTDDLIKLVELK